MGAGQVETLVDETGALAFEPRGELHDILATAARLRVAHLAAAGWVAEQNIE